MGLRNSRLWLLLRALALVGLTAMLCFEVPAATVTIINNNAPGQGFNDPTPTAPVGGNVGTTLGAQRLIAFQYAADIWGGLLASAVPIRVGAQFDPLLPCSATSAVLGSAGPSSAFRDFVGAPVAATYYPVALANALRGSDLDVGSADIDATFNGAIGTTCAFPSVWYYGLDASPPGSQIDFVSVLVHELGHGLGFLTFVDETSGAKFFGFNDTFMRHLEDHGATPSDYPSMTNAQRVAASTDTGNLHWVGSNVRAAAALLTTGKVGDHVRMYAPSPLVAGSSVSHWDTTLGPDQIMEPSYTGPLHNPSLELPLFEDLGWTLLSLVPDAAVSPTSLLFGSQNLNTTSVAQTITLSATGTGTLDIASIVASGDFAQATTCGTSLAAGSNCSITVTFTPTVVGSRAGAITITSNASGSPHTVSLSGSGKGNQAILFGTAPSIVVGGNGTVTATGGGSSNPVVFSSLTTSTCTASGTNGSSITGVAAGPCTIAANQAGDTNYNAAPQVTQSMTVNKVSQSIGTISFSPTTLTVGATSTASASATSGLPVTFSSSATPTLCSVSGSIVTGLAAGTCTIAANQTGNATYAAASQVTQNITVTASSHLVNLSTRGRVQTGDNVMIGGFILQGSTPKTVLIRAVGPALANSGVSGVLANPKLDLYSGQTVIASNDNWQAASNAAAVTATGLAPANSLESAILTNLNPGAYTAIVSGVSSGTGVAIVEVYEIDHPENPVINISTRGQVQTGDNVMIGGFIIQGSASQTVLIRAVGPNLANSGVTGVLANPKLDLYSGQTVIASNDNWQTAANAAAISASGLAPVNPLESAILITLQPGAYTAIVSGADGGSGVGMVEVFAQ